MYSCLPRKIIYKTGLCVIPSVIIAFLFVSVLSQPAYGQISISQQIGKKFFQRTPKHFPTIEKNFLPEDEISRLAQYAKIPGKLGDEVGKLRLSEAAHVDTFLRVAVKNGVLTATQETAVRKMGNVDGLASLLSKINSVSSSQVKGHLKELDIGIACNNRGGKVLAFGKKFNDGAKQADTDLDVLLEMNGKTFAIESKAYQSEIATDMVRADLASLEHFCNNLKPGTIPLFCFDKAPPELAQRVLQAKNVKFLTGTGEAICTKLELLAY